MKEIQLSQGKVALVDDADYDALAAVKWCSLRTPYTFYATRHMPCASGGSKPQEKMHCHVLARALGRDLVKGEQADHINGDGLDNRRENLRVATPAQNGRNRHRRKRNTSSRYLGVTWHTARGKWGAQITVNYKHIHLGLYVTEMAAAQAREVFIAAHPELHARSNFPKEEAA